MIKRENVPYIPVEDLLKKVESRYNLVVLASRRAVELGDGGKRLIDISPLAKISTIALEEIREGKVNCKESEKSK